MDQSRPLYVQCGGEAIIAEKLADGSTAIFDQRSKSVHSLNPSATVVWEACAGGATLAQIAAALEALFGMPLKPGVCLEAIAQLRQAGLIETDEPIPAGLLDHGRRSVLRAAGTLAVPVVLTLTTAQQRVYATLASSGTTTEEPATSTTTTTTAAPTSTTTTAAPTSTTTTAAPTSTTTTAAPTSTTTTAAPTSTTTTAAPTTTTTAAPTTTTTTPAPTTTAAPTSTTAAPTTSTTPPPVTTVM